jgi:two-component sensor histidine kinase
MHNPNNINTIANNIIQDIFEDSRGNLWIGTEGGLDKLNIESNEILHFKFSPQNDFTISDNRIQSRCIIEDRFGYLWVGTWQGLNRFHIDNSSAETKFLKIFKKDGLSDNRIISIMEDKTSLRSDSLILWIGTIGGGLNKISAKINNGEIEEYSIKIFTEKDGLPSNVIYGILDDLEGNLWLSTNKGISKFKPATFEFRNYDIDDGLQSNQFFWGAFHKTKDGSLYFGGINGINSFNPNNFKENNNIPPLFITQCKIESADGQRNYLVDNITELQDAKKINLPYDSYNVSFDFAALDLTTPNKNSYKYILKNFDENWSDVTNLNYKSYTNLSDGDYEFIVIGSNNDGVWNEKGSVFLFSIATPFWKAWWFILIIFIALASLIGYLVITQIKNMLAVERIRTKLAADLHDNIGSSLTEISILTEVITTRLKSEDKDIIKSLSKISTKSRNLIDKMSDIVWLVNPKRDSLYDLILRLQDSYSDLLADTSISFKCKNLKSLEKVSLSMEHRQHLFLIFKEAINNAITHSNCTELILNANVNGKILKMTLKDNGDGFDTVIQSHGNGLENMKDRASKIGGKLAINSEKGNGTVVNYFGYIH